MTRPLTLLLALLSLAACTQPLAPPAVASVASDTTAGRFPVTTIPEPARRRIFADSTSH